MDEKFAEAEVEKIRAHETIINKTASVTEAKAKPFLDPGFLNAREKHQETYAYRKLVQVMFENATRFSNLISREITRRVGRDPREGRVR